MQIFCCMVWYLSGRGTELTPLTGSDLTRFFYLKNNSGYEPASYIGSITSITMDPGLRKLQYARYLCSIANVIMFESCYIRT